MGLPGYGFWGYPVIGLVINLFLKVFKIILILHFKESNDS